MKKIISLNATILFLLLVCAVFASCGIKQSDSIGLDYQSNGDGTCRVVGIGSCTDAEIVIPRRSPENEIVTAIDKRAFEGCLSITGVTIPNSVTNIGEWAFCDCAMLTSVTIPDSVTSIENAAFGECSTLTNIDLGNGVQTIGDQVFQGCWELTSIAIPDSVISIGVNAFYLCKNLESVTFGAKSQLTSIGSAAFLGCANLKSIAIPAGVTEIGSQAFMRCKSFTSLGPIGSGASVELPGSVVAIENRVFTECTGLTTINIPDGVVSIAENAFGSCKELVDVTIPASVTSISGGCFRSCDRVTEIVVASNNPAFESKNGNLYNKGSTVLIQYAAGKNESSFVIPDSVTAIAIGRFMSVPNLRV